jgi:hypothetical protein
MTDVTGQTDVTVVTDAMDAIVVIGVAGWNARFPVNQTSLLNSIHQPHRKNR